MILDTTTAARLEIEKMPEDFWDSLVEVCYGEFLRVSVLGRLGKLKHWLQVHIFFCTMGPFLILLHSAFRVGGIVAIAFWSMALVVGSGTLCIRSNLTRPF